MINDAAKLVFSRSRKEVTWKNSRLIPELDPRGIDAMKRQPGKDMIIFGSGSIVSQLTQHGLIDEYQLVVSPVLLGGGVSLIRDVPGRLKLQLLEAKAYPTGNVMLRYAPAG
jgi:dihydrofolate reductase